MGTDARAEVVLDGARVSVRHAELQRQGMVYLLRDCESETGTWLSGQRVQHGVVEPEQVIRIGDWVGVFSADASPGDFGEIFPGFFGGPELRSSAALLERAAVADIPILLIGETGTGKDCFARAIHQLSGRQGPFFPVNCAALPEQLAEAELFGYRRGAFTGAHRASIGHFRAADGGTLFLDEAAELPHFLQAKLLRVLDDGRVLGLGESRAVPTDVRIVAASQRPLPELVEAGVFRRDLAARLTGFELRLPLLAERRADIACLFAEFLKRFGGERPPAVEARAVEALCLHDWPQNVRELLLLTKTLLALHGHEPVLGLQHLPSFSSCPAQVDAPPRSGFRRQKHDRTEIERISEALLRCGGNLKAAAASLGISRQRVYRVLNATADGRAPLRASRETRRPQH